MEFKYRATDTHRNQAPQGGPKGLGPNTECPNEYRWNPIGMHGANWRELEKQKIREEILAEERRMLEAEVRRELAIERQLAMRTGGDGFLSMPAPVAMSFDPRAHPAPQPFPHRAEGMSLEERLKLLEGRLGVSVVMKPGEFGGAETTPFQSLKSKELRTSEVKPASEISKEKERIVLLADPEADVSGVKRKAEITLAVGDSELSSAGVMQKKVNGDWRCAICRVSTTSEQALNEHLQGKKHKSKEAGLRKNGGSYSIGFCSKLFLKTDKVAKIAADLSADQGKDVVGESVQPEKLENTSLLMVSNSVTLKDSEQKKKEFPYWCEMCQKGAKSEIVMESHRTGKKHMARLQKANQNGGAVPSTQACKDPSSHEGKDL